MDLGRLFQSFEMYGKNELRNLIPYLGYPMGQMKRAVSSHHPATSNSQYIWFETSANEI